MMIDLIATTNIRNMFYCGIVIGSLLFLVEYFFFRATHSRSLVSLMLIFLGTFGLSCVGHSGAVQIFAGISGLQLFLVFAGCVTNWRQEKKALIQLMWTYGIDASAYSFADAKRLTRTMQPIDTTLAVFLKTRNVPIRRWQTYAQSGSCLQAVRLRLVASVKELDQLLEQTSASPKTSVRI